MPDLTVRPVDAKRRHLAVVRHLEDLPRQYAALEHAMATFGPTSTSGSSRRRTTSPKTWARTTASRRSSARLGASRSTWPSWPKPASSSPRYRDRRTAMDRRRRTRSRIDRVGLVVARLVVRVDLRGLGVGVLAHPVLEEHRSEAADRSGAARRCPEVDAGLLGMALDLL
jgi:hypothetical protein